MKLEGKLHRIRHSKEDKAGKTEFIDQPKNAVFFDVVEDVDSLNIETWTNERDLIVLSGSKTIFKCFLTVEDKENWKKLNKGTVIIWEKK